MRVFTSSTNTSGLSTDDFDKICESNDKKYKIINISTGFPMILYKFSPFTKLRQNRRNDSFSTYAERTFDTVSIEYRENFWYGFHIDS